MSPSRQSRSRGPAAGGVQAQHALDFSNKWRGRTIARLKLLVSIGSWALYAGAKDRFGCERPGLLRPVSPGEVSPIDDGGGGGVLPISDVLMTGLGGGVSH